MSPKEFLEKCECEGGGIHNGFDYGLTPSDLDDTHKEFKDAIQQAYKLFCQYDAAINRAEEILSFEDFEE